MRALVLAVAFLLLVSGLGFAAQSSKEQGDRSSKHQSRMMEEMMKDNKEGSHMGGMMRMMKMMEQCGAMMESDHSKSEANESHKKDPL